MFEKDGKDQELTFMAEGLTKRHRRGDGGESSIWVCDVNKTHQCGVCVNMRRNTRCANFKDRTLKPTMFENINPILSEIKTGSNKKTLLTSCVSLDNYPFCDN